jgi:FkbM family methyltransferase
MWLRDRLKIWSKRPLPWTDPRQWLRRRVRGMLKGPAHLIEMRIVDRVGFGRMRGGDFAYIIDVGVANGTFDLYERFPRAFLELFEPDPSHHVTIARDILGKRKGRLHRMALGDAHGSTVLYLSGVTGSSLYPIAGKTNTAATPIGRLDQSIDRARVERPCLLKIDTEGHELAILRGAVGIIDLIDSVVVEVHFDKPHCYWPGMPIDFLGEHGFHLVDVLDSHIRDGHFVCADLVFVRNPSDYRPLPALTR